VREGTLVEIDLPADARAGGVFINVLAEFDSNPG
jgi:hypothetical protein